MGNAQSHRRSRPPDLENPSVDSDPQGPNPTPISNSTPSVVSTNLSRMSLSRNNRVYPMDQSPTPSTRAMMRVPATRSNRPPEFIVVDEERPGPSGLGIQMPMPVYIVENFESKPGPAPSMQGRKSRVSAKVQFAAAIKAEAKKAPMKIPVITKKTGPPSSKEEHSVNRSYPELDKQNYDDETPEERERRLKLNYELGIRVYEKPSSTAPPKNLKNLPVVPNSVSTIPIFLSDWRRKTKDEPDVIPDPDLKPEYITIVRKRIDYTYGWLMCSSVLVFSTFFHAWSSIPKVLFSRKVMMEIYLPFHKRKFGSIFDNFFYIHVIAFFGGMLKNHPNPKTWGFWVLRLNRFIRWFLYFLVLSYVFVMIVYWIQDLTLIEDKLEKAMYKAVNDTELHPNHVFKPFDIAQKYYRCCGVKSPDDWLTNPNTFIKDYHPDKPNEMTLFYPWSCCNNIEFDCTTYPTVDKVWKSGCLQSEINMTYATVGFGITFQICSIIISFVGAYYIFVLEILILKVEGPEVMVAKEEPAVPPDPKPRRIPRAPRPPPPSNSQMEIAREVVKKVSNSKIRKSRRSDPRPMIPRINRI